MVSTFLLVIILVREDFHQKPEVAEEEEKEMGGFRAEGAEARRPSCRRRVFRTVKGIWSLRLLARGSRERRQGKRQMSSEKSLKEH